MPPSPRDKEEALEPSPESDKFKPPNDRINGIILAGLEEIDAYIFYELDTHILNKEVWLRQGYSTLANFFEIIEIQVYGSIKQDINDRLEEMFRNLRPFRSKRHGYVDSDKYEEENKKFLTQKVVPMIESILRRIQEHNPGYVAFVENTKEFDGCKPAHLTFKALFELEKDVVAMFAVIVLSRAPCVDRPDARSKGWSSEPQVVEFDYEVWQALWRASAVLHHRDKASQLFGKTGIDGRETRSPVQSVEGPPATGRKACNCPKCKSTGAPNSTIPSQEDNRRKNNEEYEARLETYRAHFEIIKNLNTRTNTRILSCIKSLGRYIIWSLKLNTQTAQRTVILERLQLIVYNSIKQEKDHTLGLIRKAPWSDPVRDPPRHGYRIVGLVEHAKENRRWLIGVVFPVIKRMLSAAQSHNSAYISFVKVAGPEDFDDSVMEHRVLKAICELVEGVWQVFAEAVEARLPFVEFEDAPGWRGKDFEGVWREVECEVVAVHRKALRVFGMVRGSVLCGNAEMIDRGSGRN